MNMHKSCRFDDVRYIKQFYIVRSSYNYWRLPNNICYAYTLICPSLRVIFMIVQHSCNMILAIGWLPNLISSLFCKGKIPLMKQIAMASSTLNTTITTQRMTYAAMWPVVRTPITMGQLASVVGAFAGVMVCATVVLAATTGFSVWKKNACTVTVLEWKEGWG